MKGFVEVFTAAGQSHEGIVASGRRLVLSDGRIGTFTWRDYATFTSARKGDVVRQFEKTACKYRYWQAV